MIFFTHILSIQNFLNVIWHRDFFYERIFAQHDTIYYKRHIIKVHVLWIVELGVCMIEIILSKIYSSFLSIEFRLCVVTGFADKLSTKSLLLMISS